MANDGSAAVANPDGPREWHRQIEELQDQLRAVQIDRNQLHSQLVNLQDAGGTMSPESVDALESAARRACSMFEYHAKERADWQGLLDNPKSWRRPGSDPDGQRRRIQARSADEHATACKYRDEYNAIMADLEAF